MNTALIAFMTGYLQKNADIGPNPPDQNKPEKPAAQIPQTPPEPPRKTENISSVKVDPKRKLPKVLLRD